MKKAVSISAGSDELMMFGVSPSGAAAAAAGASNASELNVEQLNRESLELEHRLTAFIERLERARAAPAAASSSSSSSSSSSVSIPIICHRLEATIASISKRLPAVAAAPRSAPVVLAQQALHTPKKVDRKSRAAAAVAGGAAAAAGAGGGAAAAAANGISAIDEKKNGAALQRRGSAVAGAARGAAAAAADDDAVDLTADSSSERTAEKRAREPAASDTQPLKRQRHDAAPSASSSSSAAAAAAGGAAPAAAVVLDSTDEEVARMYDPAYKERKEKEDFENLMKLEYTCEICSTFFDPTKPVGVEHLLTIDKCEHHACTKCIRAMLQRRIAAPPTNTDITCPVSNCTKSLAQRIQKRVLGEEEFGRLEAHHMKATNLAQCPNPKCGKLYDLVSAAGAGAGAGAGADAKQKPDLKKRESVAAAGSGGATVAGPDGKPLAGASLLDYQTNRRRCRDCSTDWCGACQTSPYHLGFTCASLKTYAEAKKCRFCTDAVTKENVMHTPAKARVAAAAAGDKAFSAASAGQKITGKSKAAIAARKVAEAAQAAAIAAIPIPPTVAPAGAVCNKPECITYASTACTKTLACGHFCCGVRDEEKCLPCLDDACVKGSQAKGGDFCGICYAEGLSAAPCISLGCGHTFHAHCARSKVGKGWPGARITFGFLSCPLCKQEMAHPELQAVIKKVLKLKEAVLAKAVERLKIEGLEKDPAFTDAKGKYYGRKADYALDRFAFYECNKCNNPFFGGRRACEDAAMGGDFKFKKEDLVCGSCAAGPDVENCKTHGKEYIDFKCKFCCNIATFFCWGTTHFCETCHKKQETGDYVTKYTSFPACSGAATCPTRMKHPANGTAEFALGCSFCRIRVS